MIRHLAFAALVLAGAADANPLKLGFPVDCTLGDTCFIQNYVDSDPSENYQDFTCGALSYDGHSGTDIALPDLRAMDQGVAVFPAAPGTVRAVRDEMPDINAKDPNAPDLTSRACGNAVVVDHGGGWGTRYCHLKLGSVSVKKGDRVNLSTQIGEIGLSGRTEFPHLHIALTKDGAPVDPFNLDATPQCGEPHENIWADDINYRPGGMLDVGFATAIPSFVDIKAGTAAVPVLPSTAAAIVFWVHVFGTQIDDTLVFSIQGPNGTFLERTVTLERTQARAFRAVGRKLAADAWPIGSYTGRVSMLRQGNVIGSMDLAISVTD